MPQVVTYCQRRHDGTWLRLYVPVLPVVLVLSPVLVLVALAGLVACVAYRVSPADAARGTGRVLFSLSGSQFHLDDGRTAVHVNLW